MLLTRWVKHHHFMNNNVRKYLGYALGEIVLVIVGILVALQIDAWYEDNQITKNLNLQLQAVTESISQDSTNITRLKRQRIDAIFRSNRIVEITGPQETPEQWYNRKYVEFTSEVLASSQIPAYFVASTGAYQNIESAGYTNHINDDSLKRNLHDYYATVERIVFAEREMNNFIQQVILKFQTETSKGFSKLLIREPLLAWEPQLFDDDEIVHTFRESYRELLLDSVTQALVRSGRNQLLLKEYEHLLSLGHILTDQINAHIGHKQYARASNEVFLADEITGPSGVFHQGRIEAHTLGLFTAPTSTSMSTDTDGLRMEQDQLRVTYHGGNEWAFLYALVGPVDISVRKQSLDYSRFDRIRLVLKRHSSCANLRLVMKDADDSDDGTQANIRLDLTDQWETYEYDLSLFSDANLRRLSVVTGFLMDNKACSFSIRDVTFLKPGDA